jgi:hypothetical protein
MAPLLWTAATLVASWAVGRVVAALLIARLPESAPTRPPSVSSTAIAIVRRRLPWWALLVGVWVASGFWPLTNEARLLIERVVFVAGALSATLAAAAAA